MSRRIISGPEISGSRTVRPAEGFNLLEVEDMARGMIRRAQASAEELVRKCAALEEEYRKRREELAEEYRGRRDALERELADLRGRTQAELDALRKEVHEKASKEGFEQGYGEGLIRGRADGLEQGRREGADAAAAETRARLADELGRAIAALGAIAAELAARRGALLRDAERDVVQLALAIAEKIVKREVRVDPDVVLNNARKALEIIAQRTGATLEVNPDDLAHVEAHAPAALEIFRESGSLSIAPNAHVERGGCMVTSAGAGADLRIRTQLELIEQALMGEGQGEHTGGTVPTGTCALERA